MQSTFYYLIHIQYLGFRFHGWSKQPGLKTLHSMVDKTLEFVLGHNSFKTLGSSRTDAMVSANHFAFELFINEPLKTSSFLTDLNSNFPSDIRSTKVEKVDEHFNIINSPKIKEYVYLFSFGEKAHPFSASIVSSFQENLDIELMKQGAQVFLGKHNFKKYCTKPSKNTILEREILVSEIIDNDLYTANFFPKKSFIYKVQSKGFLRNQIRLMMGQLLEVGRQNISVSDIKNSLHNPDDAPLRNIAPASGLILNKVEFLT